MRARPLLLAMLLVALAAPPSALAAKEVSYPEVLAQVKSGPLVRAVINRTREDIEIKFRDSSEWKAFYPHGAQPMLQRILHERHVRVIFASQHRARPKPAKVHHHLRYIAAGVLAALAVIGAAAFLYTHRRTPRAAGGQAPAPGA